MLPSDVISLALQRVNMTVAEVGDGNATVGATREYQYLNMVKDKVWAAIVASATGKDFSWEEWTQNFTALQGEYPLPQVVSDENRLKKIQCLSVTYTTDTFSRTGALIYTPARYVDRKNQEYDWAWYEENQPQSEPIYCVSDKAIFVAPVSSNTVVNGMKLTGVKKIPDYDTNTTEAGMVIPDDYHYLLVDWLEVELLRKQGATALANQQGQVYKANTIEVLNTSKDSQIWPYKMEYPDDWFMRGNWRGTNTHITLP